MKNRLETNQKRPESPAGGIGERLAVSRQTISSLENGRYNPSILLAFKIARFLENIEDIFIYEEEQ